MSERTTDERRDANRSSSASPEAHQENPIAKFLIELAPLAVFFVAYKLYGIQTATAAIIFATLVSLAASWLMFRKVAVMPVVSAVVITVLGGLTLYLDNPTFLYLKPTIVNTVFASILGIGLATGRPLIKVLLDGPIKLTDEGWTKLTVRWMVFFLFLALLNEVVWRNFPEATWVNFKVLGIFPITLLFVVAQVSLIKRYSVEE
jgi:intracellular septation protein